MLSVPALLNVPPLRVSEPSVIGAVLNRFTVALLPRLTVLLMVLILLIVVLEVPLNVMAPVPVTAPLSVLLPAPKLMTPTPVVLKLPLCE